MYPWRKFKMDYLNLVTPSVVRVGDGRGFVVAGKYDRLIITAAHCLPFFPPCISFSSIEERTYENLLGPLGAEPTVWAECLFVDPIGDIAVLGPPDNQDLSDQHEQYDDLLDPLEPISIADAPAKTAAWLLSLDKQWCQCVVRHVGGPLWFSNATDGIHGGMSGSPVLLRGGSAIAIVCTAGGTDSQLHTEGGPNPRTACGQSTRMVVANHGQSCAACVTQKAGHCREEAAPGRRPPRRVPGVPRSPETRQFQRYLLTSSRLL
jgi:hypothetical protein